MGQKILPVRVQHRRLPRRPLEAQRIDFERWDAAAAAVGITWSAFARQALDFASIDVNASRVSEKGAPKNGARARAKATGTRAGRKG